MFHLLSIFRLECLENVKFQLDNQLVENLMRGVKLRLLMVDSKVQIEKGGSFIISLVVHYDIFTLIRSVHLTSKG